MLDRTASLPQRAAMYNAHPFKIGLFGANCSSGRSALNIRISEFQNDREVSHLRYEDELMRLRNEISIVSRELERELAYTREKKETEKTIEIEALKKNYAGQFLFLEDEIGKLKATNNLKTIEFENQLELNRTLKIKHDEEMKSFQFENDSLRERMRKLEELNRSEV